MEIKKIRKFVLAGAILFGILAGAVITAYIQYHRGEEAKEQIELGNHYMSELKYEQAIASYRQALEFDHDNSEVNLKLAEAYEGNQMYSYAEDIYKYLIEEDPTDITVCEKLTDLYIRLERYEDARQFLTDVRGKTEDEKIDQLYEETQPEKPMMNYDSGRYNERIKVDITSPQERNTIYYTLDGTEPDKESEIYAGGIVLPNGQTTVKAIAVNSLGFSSEIASNDYDIAIMDRVVEIEEPVIENIVRNELEIPYDQPIYNDDIELITKLYVVGWQVAEADNRHSVLFEKNTYSVDGYEYDLTYGGLSTLNDVGNMPFLETIVVAYQQDLDISALSTLNHVKELSLAGNNLNNTDISVLSGMESLESLNLGWNDISDISALSGLNNLISLGVWGNNLRDISAVQSLSELTYLDFSDNQIKDITAVQALGNLEQLWMYHNEINDISSVTNLDKLSVLMVYDNPVSNPEVIRSIYPHLTRLDVDLLGLGE